MTSRRIIIGCLLIIPVILLVSLLAVALVKSQSTSDSMVSGDRIAPDISVSLVSGDMYSLSDSDATVTVIDFWSSWCIPCVEEAPMLQEFYSEYQSRGVEILGIAIWDTRENVEEHIARFGLTYANALDEDGLIAIDYGVRGIPEKHFVVSDGQDLRKISGPVDKLKLREVVEELLENQNRKGK